MADGVTTQNGSLATIPTATTIATDDAGAAGHVQMVKIAVPTGGSATAWGDATIGLPVEVTGGIISSTVAKGDKDFTDPGPSSSASSVAAADPERISLTIHNAGTVTVYLGKDNTVTTSNGFPLVAGATLSDETSVDAWWGITASGTGDLRIIAVA